MIDEEVIKGLRVRYKNIHPLIFHRSIEKSKTAVELFDILDTFPEEGPVVWSNKEKCWKKTDNVFQKFPPDRKRGEKKDE